MKKIDVEAHFYTREYHDYVISHHDLPRAEMYKSYVRLWYGQGVWEPHPSVIEDRLMDTGQERLRIMDGLGIDVQILSLSTPGCEQFDSANGLSMSRKTNETLSAEVESHPAASLVWRHSHHRTPRQPPES